MVGGKSINLFLIDGDPNGCINVGENKMTLKEAVEKAKIYAKHRGLVVISECTQYRDGWDFGFALKKEPDTPIPGIKSLRIYYDGRLDDDYWYTIPPKPLPQARRIDISEYL